MYSDEEMDNGLIISFTNNLDAGNDEYTHFRKNGIHAFLGSPIRITGKKDGILSFFSKHPIDHSFTDSEKDFLSLMSQWIKTELERIEASRQLQQYSDEIEAKNKDLANARDRALEASNLKSVFLAMMSHEIRTPMNAIIGMNEIMMETNLDAEQREFAAIISESAASLLRILNDILDFSKIEAGKLVIKTERISIEKLAADVVDLYKEKLNRKGIKINLSIDPVVPAQLSGDPVRIGQVLLNLLSNAVKFTEKGEINIRVNGTNMNKNYILTTFSVEDSGIGIPEQKRKHLFDPFTQADESVTRKYGGTGLGLAISRRLVELMHGELGYITNEKQGSTFWFSLPLLIKKDGQLVDSEPSEKEENILKQKKYLVKFESYKPVLIVENDMGSRNLFEQQLAIFGLKTIHTSNGLDAIELIKNNPDGFSLLLMDINMPDMDGLTATKLVRLQEAGSKKHIPIIAVTANAMLGDRETCLSAGMDDYLSKPIRLNDMRAVLEKWIRLDE
ncbi:MAG: ATP-binding protein, partial [Chloroflexota bacterium]